MWPGSFLRLSGPLHAEPSSLPLCEDLGFGLPEPLGKRLRAPFSAPELERGFRRASAEAATATVASGRQPTAVWILGASAVGKSTIAPLFAQDLGIPAADPDACRSQGDGGSRICDLDAVLLDGDILRLEHAGYQEVVRDGLDRGCTWRSAYPALRSQVRNAKDTLFSQSVARRQNLVIPHTCQRLERDCLWMLRELLSKGYVNHLVIVEGDRDEIRRRGVRRASALGKSYAANEYAASLRSFGPMSQHANGQVLRVWNTGPEAPLVTSRSEGGTRIHGGDATS